TAAGEEVARLDEQGGTTGLAIAPDGRTVVIAGATPGVLRWRPGAGAENVPLEGYRDSLLALSPDGKTLAAAGPDRMVRLWDTAGGRRRALRGLRAPRGGAAFSPDGGFLAGGAPDASIRLWDVASGDEAGLLRPPGQPSGVPGPPFCFSPD